MLYFGRDFLCGLDPPVLKLKFIAPSLSEYVSVVEQQAAIVAVAGAELKAEADAVQGGGNRDPGARSSLKTNWNHQVCFYIIVTIVTLCM